MYFTNKRISTLDGGSDDYQYIPYLRLLRILSKNAVIHFDCEFHT